MKKLCFGAAVCALGLVGCGGSSKHASTQTTSTPAIVPAPPAVTTSTPTTATPTVHTASQPSPSTPTSAAPGTTSTASGSSSGGVAPTGSSPVAPPGRTAPITNSPNAEDVAKAKAALPGCQKNEPGITLEQLEQEAASPEGIQC